VVIPCLNENDTIAKCVVSALDNIRKLDVEGEVIVADNGSTDGSPDIAAAAGARVVTVSQKGYGNALMGGIHAAGGKYIVIADADDSYDFGDVGRLLEKLRDGQDLVLGCRFPSGGGRILPGAMPFLHRWLGNPMFSLLVRWYFQAPIHDVNCGMRGLRKEFYRRLDQRCPGMPFAAEMVIKACLLRGKIAEVPIALRPDGRDQRAPHLRTFRDGWQTLRVFLAFAPQAFRPLKTGDIMQEQPPYDQAHRCGRRSPGGAMRARESTQDRISQGETDKAGPRAADSHLHLPPEPPNS
jgi:glycosyltransferase involved in cell wall biosynthesis